MKRLIATTAILATLGTSAFAMVSAQPLPVHLKREVLQLVPDAELANLTTRQVAAIHGILATGGSDGAWGERPAALKVILAWD